MRNPIVAIIGGTGVGEKMASATRGEKLIVETPFGPPSGTLLRAHWEGVDLVFLSRHGDGHLLPPTAVPYRANIWALKSLGVTHVLASGAVGSLREEIRPRDLVVPDQAIDRTYRRIGTFFDEPGIAAHVEFAEPFCPHLRQRLLAAAPAALADSTTTAPRGAATGAAAGASPASSPRAATTVHDGGTYVCMEGPAFSTVAESRMHRAWGGDLIGMTCMPEARLAREAEMCYAMLALPTDYDCWRPHDPTKDRRALLKEIISHAQAVTESSIALFRETVRGIASHPPGPCACQQSLELAIWSDRSRISEGQWKKLEPILERVLSSP